MESVRVIDAATFKAKYDNGSGAEADDGRVDATEIVAATAGVWDELVEDLTLIPAGEERDQALAALGWLKEVEPARLAALGIAPPVAPDGASSAFDLLLQSVRASADENAGANDVGAQPGEPKLESGTNVLFPGLLSRIDHLGRKVHDAIANTAPAQAIGKTVRTVAPPVFNGVAKGVGAVVDVVGGFADGVEAGAAKVGDGIEIAGDKALAWAEHVAAELRGSADEIGSWVAEAERAQAAGEGTGDTTPRDVRNAKATSIALAAIADELDIMRSHRRGRRALAKGTEVALRVLARGVELGGKITHVVGKAASAAITFGGKVFGWLLGTNTLRNTGISIGGGLRIGMAGKYASVGAAGALFFPSLKIAEEAGSYYDGMYFNKGVGADSPVLSMSWAERGGAGSGVNLFFVSGSFNDKMQYVFIGVPGYFGIDAGRDIRRGPFTGWGTAIPLGGAGYISVGITVYSPLLEPLAIAARPIAKVITKASEVVVKGMKAAWRGIKSVFGTEAGDASQDVGDVEGAKDAAELLPAAEPVPTSA